MHMVLTAHGHIHIATLYVYTPFLPPCVFHCSGGTEVMYNYTCIELREVGHVLEALKFQTRSPQVCMYTVSMQWVVSASLALCKNLPSAHDRVV